MLHRVSTRADNTVQEPLPSVMNECLSIDLEVDVSTARINALAAWRPDIGEQLTTRNGPPDTGELSRLDRMAQGARFVLGHNLIAFDIPHLQTAYPGLERLSPPRLDTIIARLSSNALEEPCADPPKLLYGVNLCPSLTAEI